MRGDGPKVVFRWLLIAAAVSVMITIVAMQWRRESGRIYIRPSGVSSMQPSGEAFMTYQASATPGASTVCRAYARANVVVPPGPGCPDPCMAIGPPASAVCMVVEDADGAGAMAVGTQPVPLGAVIYGCLYAADANGRASDCVTQEVFWAP